jgi:hypothetical protein
MLLILLDNLLRVGFNECDLEKKLELKSGRMIVE